MTDEKIKFEMDDFTKNVIADPATSQGTVFAKGYLGESDKEGYIRLYHDPGLNYYVDIKKEEVVYSLKIPKAHDPLGGVMMWLNPPAIEPASASTNQEKGDAAAGQKYFQGNIYNQYLGQYQAPQQQAIPTASCLTWPWTACCR